MPSVDFKALAPQIVEKVGGEANISKLAHCATRLRLTLKDEAKANKAAVEKLPGVITVVLAGGQFQVVIGNNVPILYEELTKITRLGGATTDDDEAPADKNVLNRFIELISSIFLPILWPLAGTGLLKAFLTLATTFKVLDPTTTTYTILNAAADAMFNFLPLFLAVTAAKRFKANQFTSMALAGALVYPSIVALATATTPVTFFGIPVVMMSYTSSVIPIIIAVWIQSHLERLLNRVLPGWLRNFTTPLLVVLIMVPLILLTIGPVTTYIAKAISGGVNAIFGFAPWLGGAIMGGLWQVFVLFGLHWGFVPIMVNDLATQGYTLLGGPLVAAVLAQAGAALAVSLRSRSAKRREIAAPGALSGFLAGITEPIIYGVNLPLKLPFYFGIAGGAIGGAITGAGGSANDAFVFPSLLALPAYMSHGNFTLQLIGTGIAIAIGFTLTFLFGPREQPDAVGGDEPPAVPEAAAPAAAVAAGTVEILAPVTGTAVALGEVKDKVFASGAMGSGVGILPSDGTIVAPCSGTIIAAMDTGHAYGIKSPEGVEILVHVGIDTVEMGGKGFTSKATQGEEVKAGDVLGTADLAAIEAAGYDPTTILVITNTFAYAEVKQIITGAVQAGQPAVAITV